MRLADLGARVIKVESSSGDTTRRFGPPFIDGESPYFMSFNRGKESIVLDLKSKAGKEFVERVLPQADVLVENFRPGVMDRLGFADDVLSSQHPKLIRVGITGFGPQSRRHGEAAFDLAIQAESGLMSMNGEEGGESCRVPISIADLAAGSAAAEATLAALFQRERQGIGCRVDIALLDSLVALFGYQAQGSLMTGVNPTKMGHRHPNLAPYQGFATADGMIVLAVAMEAQWQRLQNVEDMPQSLSRPEWHENCGRVELQLELESCLKSVFSEQTTATWMKRLKDADVPIGPVRTVGEMISELESQQSDFLKSYQHQTLGAVRMTTSPITWEGKERDATSIAPPTLGQHSLALIHEFSGNNEQEAEWQNALKGVHN
ncbi:MAG: crotonobetainyl-CoA:carnitine CoA-transferase CaiB-like acyl-CoA transferase [Planctomycetota bacterium]|jgi:crotonobetainyl-CoA:carnitine CoA-transferase CaiB-like acyl-CoA transferase